MLNQSFTTDTADARRAALGKLAARRRAAAQRPQAGEPAQGRAATRPLRCPSRASRGSSPNLYNAQVGAMLRQLYIRQAMEDLINRPQIVSKVYNGYADPGNGPVPVRRSRTWASPLEKSGGPYPYSPSAAVALLKAHGWKVVPGGVSTCQSPGTGPSQCGAGIAAGEQLAFQLAYSSGRATTDEQNAAIQSSRGAGRHQAQPQVGAVQHADRHRGRVHRQEPIRPELRLAAPGVRLRPLRRCTRRTPATLPPAGTATTAATPTPKADSLINATAYRLRDPGVLPVRGLRGQATAMAVAAAARGPGGLQEPTWAGSRRSTRSPPTLTSRPGTTQIELATWSGGPGRPSWS